MGRDAGCVCEKACECARVCVSCVEGWGEGQKGLSVSKRVFVLCFLVYMFECLWVCE